MDKQEDIMDNEQTISAILDVASSLYEEMSDRLPDKGHTLIFKKLTELGKLLVNAERASFWKWDKKNHILWTTAASECETIVIPETTGYVGKALREGRIVITNDPYNDPDFNPSNDKKTGFVTRSIMTMPISNTKGEYIGAYQVINKIDGEFDEKEDRRRLSLAAVICGLALESDFFLDESNTDQLTQLRNRMGFYSDYNWRFNEAIKDKSRPVSVVLCDIDTFKGINDTYGHNAGDEALKLVSEVFSELCDEKCGVYRWGGDEFLIIMIDTEIHDCAERAEAIRKTVEDTPVISEDKKFGITLSMGVSDFSPDLEIAENIRLADKMLYKAKEAGRNRVCS